MRQYAIFWKRAGMPNFKQLTPAIDANLYDKTPIAAAVMAMSDAATQVEGITVRIEDELYNIVAFERDSLAPQSFPFPEPDSINILEPVDGPNQIISMLAGVEGAEGSIGSVGVHGEQPLKIYVE